MVEKFAKAKNSLMVMLGIWLIFVVSFLFLKKKMGLKAFQAIINNDYNILILYTILCLI